MTKFCREFFVRTGNNHRSTLDLRVDVKLLSGTFFLENL